MGNSAFSIIGGGGAQALGAASYLGNLNIYNGVVADQTLDLSLAGGMIVYNIEDNVTITLSSPVTGRMYSILIQKGDISGTPTVALSGDGGQGVTLNWVGNQIGTLTNPMIVSVACFENTSKLFVAMAQQQ